MKIKRIESTIKPNHFEIGDRKNNLVTVVFFDDIKTEKRTSEDNKEQIIYTYYKYELDVVYRDNLESYIEDNITTWVELAKNEFITKAAADVRAIRDKLLADSDRYVLIDRLGIKIPDTISATTMLSIIKELFSSLGNVLNGEWSTYRQALRDITKQPNFPFDVEFPTKPGEGVK